MDKQFYVFFRVQVAIFLVAIFLNKTFTNTVYFWESSQNDERVIPISGQVWLHY